ncbi:MAG: LolA family protein, partial [Fimbriimonadales bacterium]
MRTLWIAAGLLAATAVGAAQQDAKAFLKQVQQKYRNAKSWEMQVDITVETSFGGNMNRQQVRSTVAMQRPNRLAAKLGASMMAPERELYSDGRTMYIYVPGGKQYMQQPAPPNFSGTNLQFLGEAGLLIGLMEQDL